MIDAAEARQIARENIGGLGEADDDLLLEEYEDGYVARAKPDDRRDENGRPLTVGQGCIVIDKANGKVYRSAYVGPQTIEFWREDRAAGKI